MLRVGKLLRRACHACGSVARTVVVAIPDTAVAERSHGRRNTSSLHGKWRQSSLLSCQLALLRRKLIGGYGCFRKMSDLPPGTSCPSAPSEAPQTAQ